jgi:protein-S-isoprenylcysteine O-methyltransferase Ste14
VQKIWLAVATIILTIVQIGLAILGFGGFVPFFSHAALVALVVLSAVMIVVGFFSSGNLSAGVREDRSNRWVLIVFSVIGLLLAYLPAYTDRHGIATLDGETLRWIGVGLFAIGGVFRLWPVFVLGKRFSGLVAIQPEHRLVTTGIYGILRNPSYLGLLVMTLGWALAFRSGVGIILTALLLPPLIARIHAEESLLRSTFGTEYDAYCARTWRLVPWLY